MSTTVPEHTTRLLGKVATHLSTAAAHADAAAGADIFSPWAALAGQIRLTAAAVSPGTPPVRVTPRPSGTTDHLRAAGIILHLLLPGDGPPDLPIWAGQLTDLTREAVALRPHPTGPDR